MDRLGAELRDKRHPSVRIGIVLYRYYIRDGVDIIFFPLIKVLCIKLRAFDRQWDVEREF